MGLAEVTLFSKFQPPRHDRMSMLFEQERSIGSFEEWVLVPSTSVEWPIIYPGPMIAAHRSRDPRSHTPTGGLSLAIDRNRSSIRHVHERSTVLEWLAPSRNALFAGLTFPPPHVVVHVQLGRLHTASQSWCNASLSDVLSSSTAPNDLSMSRLSRGLGTTLPLPVSGTGTRRARIPRNGKRRGFITRQE